MVNILAQLFLYPVAAAPTFDSEMGASREGSTGVPGERLGSLGGRPLPLLHSSRRSTPPQPPSLARAPVRRADESRSPHRVAALWRSASAAPPRTPPTCIPSAPTPSADSRPAAAPLRLRQLARRQNRVQRGRQPHLVPNSTALGNPPV